MSEVDFDPRAGRAEMLETGLQRVLSPNPSAMTYRGTNTYLLGGRGVAVIDPGPDMPEHLSAILAALQPGQQITHIFVTHSHLDHSALAPSLSRATGAPVYAFGGSETGRSETMQRLVAGGLRGGGEGVDHGFTPDVELSDGDAVKGDEWNVRAMWTPGHMANHLSYAWDRAVFTGDVVMGWATSLVSPPDGDLGQFLKSCARLAELNARVFYPGHGAPVGTPTERALELIAHRMQRHRQIRSCMSEHPIDAATIVEEVYDDLLPGLEAAARRNVFAHLVELCEAGEVKARPALSPAAGFLRANPEKK